MSYDLLDALSRPVVQAGIVAAIGVVCVVFRRYRFGIGLLAMSLLWAWLSSTPAFATWLQQGLIGPYPPRPAASYPKEPVIVVLGGGGASGPEHFRVTPDDRVPTTRIGFGLRLYEAGRAPMLFLSGGDGDALLMADVAHRQGIPADALQTETRSRTTHQNALYSAAILKREDQQRILLVTSSLHMSRAAASFRRQGLTVIPAPVPHARTLPANSRHDWWPQHRAEYLTRVCLHEIFGLWGYKLLGWA